jgi:hypothetical protein
MSGEYFGADRRIVCRRRPMHGQRGMFKFSSRLNRNLHSFMRGGWRAGRWEKSGDVGRYEGRITTHYAADVGHRKGAGGQIRAFMWLKLRRITRSNEHDELMTRPPWHKTHELVARGVGYGREKFIGIWEKC